MVRKASETYGILGQIILNPIWGRRFFNFPPSQIKISLSQIVFALSLLERRDPMPRRARQESATGIYHVMTRGLNKLPIFKQEREKTRIVNIIRENIPKYNVEIYAYCIMPNHLHLLIKSEINELASFMAKILAAYAQYYNFKHNRIGYVFQDRYKSQCIEQESYFWNCLRYIHLNPLKEKCLETLLDNKHNSFAEFYYVKKDIIHEKAFEMLRKRFPSNWQFADFHNMENRDVFVDVSEDIFQNNLKIAKQILKELQLQYGFAMEEILDYAESRKNFENKLSEVLNVSMKKVREVEMSIRKDLKGTG